ncbi:MAG: DUF1446 domain-containing protein [Planctomycetales bacterium]|nr:DUF1446 domain-containing protein [Planctomycetales bacterium]
MTLRIANGAGFLGDDLAAPRRLVEAAEVDYLTLEYLAELTMSILARQRQRHADAGFARDWLEVLESLTPALKSQPRLRIVTNAGGVNPAACVAATARLLEQSGLGETRIGMVAGDDLLPMLEAADFDHQRCPLENLDTGEPLSSLASRVVSANAYLGARPIASALAQNARIVITGRVADASLTVGPAMHEFGWAWDDWDRLATATVAGHLIECGAQATGGYSTSWADVNLFDIGYPIAELTADGDVVITKPAGSGGSVTRQTIAEQLVYEIGDPAAYLTPDVTADFQHVELQQIGADRVRVSGAAGRPATDTYKVSLAYEDGYMASGQLLVWGSDCVAKAHRCAELIMHRVAQAGYKLQRTHVELLGAGAAAGCVPPLDLTVQSPTGAPRELMLRVTVHDPDAAAVTRFTREFAPLITSGPAGLAGYATGRPQVRPVYAYWPTLIAKAMVPSRVDVAAARQWSI